MKGLVLCLALLPRPSLAATATYIPNTSSDISNPERGWFVAMYYYGHGIGNNNPLNQANFQNQVNAPGNNVSGDTHITLVKRIYDLGGIYGGASYANQPLDSNVLQDISTDFSMARELGIKLILRFDYNEGGSGTTGSFADAPESVILNHVAQLAPLLTANEDVIAYMEAGFIGEWGEWHDSTHGLTDPANNNAVPAEADILNAVLAALPSDRMVAVRYPGYVLEIFNTTLPISPGSAFNGGNYARCGTHDDCFESDSGDGGTFDKGTSLGWTQAQFRAFLSQQNDSVQEGGETCGTSAYSSCANSLADLQSQHWSALHCEYDQANIAQWVSNGCINQISMGLGYRYTLIQSTLPASATAGGNLALSFQVTNSGFANCFNARGLELILRPSGQAGGQGTAIAIPQSSAQNTDPRFWQPGQSYTANLNLALPGSLAPGSYEALLNLPDPKPSLHAMPAYAIQLANQGIWEASTGYNKLNQNIQIEPCPGCAAKPDVQGLAVAPNPSQGSPLTLSFTLPGNADSVEIQVYSAAMTLLLQAQQGAKSYGRQSASLDASALGNGAYYVRVAAQSSLGRGKAAVAKLMILR
jgi:hypothetical protein